MLVRIKNFQGLVRKLDKAMSNVDLALDAALDQAANKIHQDLSQQTRYFFFRKYRTLPEPTAANYKTLLNMTTSKKYKGSDTEKIVALRLQKTRIVNICRIAEKASKLPEFELILSSEEVDLINDWFHWVGSSGSDKPVLPR